MSEPFQYEYFHLKFKLEQLKEAGSKGLKAYKDMPVNSIEHGDLLYTYAIEETLVGPQKTLTISHFHKGAFELALVEHQAIESVFGKFTLYFTRSYFMRGYSIQLVQK